MRGNIEEVTEKDREREKERERRRESLVGWMG